MCHSRTPPGDNLDPGFCGDPVLLAQHALDKASTSVRHAPTRGASISPEAPEPQHMAIAAPSARGAIPAAAVSDGRERVDGGGQVQVASRTAAAAPQDAAKVKENDTGAVFKGAAGASCRRRAQETEGGGVGFRLALPMLFC